MKIKGNVRTFSIAQGGPGWITVGAQNWQPVELRVGNAEIGLRPVRDQNGAWITPKAEAVVIEFISKNNAAGGLYLSEAEARELVAGLADALDLKVTP